MSKHILYIYVCGAALQGDSRCNTHHVDGGERIRVLEVNVGKYCLVHKRHRDVIGHPNYEIKQLQCICMLLVHKQQTCNSLTSLIETPEKLSG
jgi:hypothetical protein